MQLRHRHVQLVALGVFDGEKFAVAAANIEFEQALIAADAMIDVHDGRADRQFRKIADDGFRIACGALAPSALLRAFAQQFVFGEQAQGWLVQGKALLQCGHGDGKARSCLGVGEILPRAHRLNLHAGCGNLFNQRFAATGRLGGDQNAARIAGDKAGEFGCGCFVLAVDRQRGRRLRAEVHGAFITAAGDQIDARAQVQLFTHLIWGKVQLGDGKDGAFDVVRALLVAIHGLPVKLLRGIQGTFADHEHGVVGQILEQRFGRAEHAAGKEHRQVILDAGGSGAFLDVLVQRAAAWIDREAFAQRIAEAACGFLGERKFARRQQAHALDLLRRALGFRIKGADGVDFLIQEFNAIGLRAAHRKDVDDGAAHGKVAGFEHLRNMAVAGCNQALGFFVQLEALAVFQHQTGTTDVAARCQALHERGHRHHQHATLERGQAVQGCHALREDVRMRREQVVGQGFPIGKLQHFQIGTGKCAYRGFQRVRGMGVVRDHHQRTIVAVGRFSQGQAERGTVRGNPLATLPGAARQWGVNQKGLGHQSRQTETAPDATCAQRGARSLAWPCGCVSKRRRVPDIAARFRNVRLTREGPTNPGFRHPGKRRGPFCPCSP